MGNRLVETWLALGAMMAAAAGAELRFVDVTVASGLGPFTNAAGMAAGIAAADYDGDGDVDLFVPNGLGAPDQLYRNLGPGPGGVPRFEEVAGELGLDSLDNHRGALWLDADGDGDLDLLVAGDDHMQSTALLTSHLTLWRQEAGGAFTDVTEAAGLHRRLDAPLDAPLYRPAGTEASNPEMHLGGLAAGDYDGDGRLDLLVAFWRGYSFLFRNLGTDAGGVPTFAEATADAGVARPFESYWQPVFADFDRDGAQDLFMAVDFHENFFFHQQPDGTFLDLAGPLGMRNDEQNDMGVALGDYDGDGDLDLFVSNIYSGENRRNHLYRNDSLPGAPAFTELAVAAGVADTSWGWGATFADADNDGRLDLAVTNGFIGKDDASRLFQNQGGATPSFVDVAPAAGFDDLDWGSSLIAFDADRDGDLDFLQTCVGGPLRLMRNDLGPEDGGHLVVKPRQRAGNRFAIGAVVSLEVGAARLTRPILAGSSLLGQEPAEAFFGLGGAGVVERLVVEWPAGGRSVLGGVAAGAEIEVSDAVVFSDGFETGGLEAW